MERFWGKISLTAFFAFLLLCLITMVSFMIWAVCDIWFLSLIFSIILLAVIPTFFFTNYKLYDDHISVNFGLFLVNYKINYQDILAVVPKISNKLSPALSEDCVMITYQKNGKIKTIFVSPNLFDNFINNLSDKILLSCKSQPLNLK